MCLQLNCYPIVSELKAEIAQEKQGKGCVWKSKCKKCYAIYWTMNDMTHNFILSRLYSFILALLFIMLWLWSLWHCRSLWDSMMTAIAVPNHKTLCNMDCEAQFNIQNSVKLKYRILKKCCLDQWQVSQLV